MTETDWKAQERRRELRSRIAVAIFCLGTFSAVLAGLLWHEDGLDPARLLAVATVVGAVVAVAGLGGLIAFRPVVRIEAVLNGTCNFILNRLAAGVAFDEALIAARDAGFAEEDPTADLSGLDASAKLAILAHEALDGGISPERIARETLSADAALLPGQQRGCRAGGENG